jgi:hypothetical protein
LNDRELALETLRPIVIGNEVTRVQAHPFTWQFHFQGDCFVNIECPWRVFEKGTYKFSGADHDQKFGLREPFDVVKETTRLIAGKKVTELSIAKEAADLVLHFEDEVRIELLQNSGGYEAWNVSGPDGILVVAMGGGKLAVWTRRA